jgi:hypothetical protein
MTWRLPRPAKAGKNHPTLVSLTAKIKKDYLA